MITAVLLVLAPVIAGAIVYIFSTLDLFEACSAVDHDLADLEQKADSLEKLLQRCATGAIANNSVIHIHGLPPAQEIKSERVVAALKDLSAKMQQYKALLGENTRPMDQLSNLYLPGLTALLKELASAERIHLNVSSREESCMKAINIISEVLDNRIGEINDSIQRRMDVELDAMELTAKVKGDLLPDDGFSDQNPDLPRPSNASKYNGMMHYWHEPDFLPNPNSAATDSIDN